MLGGTWTGTSSRTAAWSVAVRFAKSALTMRRNSAAAASLKISPCGAFARTVRIESPSAFSRSYTFFGSEVSLRSGTAASARRRTICWASSGVGAVGLAIHRCPMLPWPRIG